MKCFRYFISILFLFYFYFISILFMSIRELGVKVREVRLLWKEGREALSILFSVRSVRCALKGLDWVE